MIVADSDVLIDYLRGNGRFADRVEIELSTRDFATTSVTAFELRCGIRSARQARAVETLLDAMTILPLDDEAARCAADVRRSLLAAGQDIGMADSLIAGICIATRSVLVTGNRRHFERVKGLALSTGADDSP